jgi:hypothetical protein
MKKNGQITRMRAKSSHQSVITYRHEICSLQGRKHVKFFKDGGMPHDVAFQIDISLHKDFGINSGGEPSDCCV